jgi:hypothetical protein
VSDQNNEVEVSSVTAEEGKQIQEQMEAIKAAVRTFIADPLHERYKPTEENRTAIETYLQEKGLDATAETLHAAYEHLAGESKLDLFEESKVEAPKSKSKSEDLGAWSTLGDQQRNRQSQAVAGVASPNHRNAFINACQKAKPEPVKITGRVHL